MWKCTRCGEEIEGYEYGFCWKCGSSRPSLRTTYGPPSDNSRSPVQALFDNPAPLQVQPLAQAQLVGCPTCRAQVSSQAASCPHCGHPMRAPSARGSAPPHRHYLEEVINPYKYAGYQVVQQTEYSITMVRRQQNNFSIGTAVLLWILFWPAGLWYTLSNRNTRDQVACFRVLPNGQVEISGDTLGYSGASQGSKSGNGLAWLVIGLVIFFIIIVSVVVNSIN